MVFDSDSLFGVTTFMYGGRMFMVVRFTDPLFFFRAFKFCSNCAASRHKGLGLVLYIGGSFLAFIRGGSGDAMGAHLRSGTRVFLWFVLSMTLASIALDRAFSGGFGEVGVMLINLSTCEKNDSLFV